jgi:CubicO group peptidase (beta-lactamase class C family)
VGTAIEAAVSQPFLTFMREQIFDPLGMRDTVADLGPGRAAVEGEDFPLINMVRELIYDPEATRGTTLDSDFWQRRRRNSNRTMHRCIWSCTRTRASSTRR